LGFIKGYATTLLRDDAAWDEASRREFLTIIDEETDRLKELIDNLLDSSRLQSGRLRMDIQPLRLDTMLKDLPLRAKSFNKNLIIDVNIKEDHINVNADPTRLSQVFDNLLSNAVKYAPGAKVIISLDKQDNFAHIAFSDNGAGIPPENLPNIFTRFYRVPNQNKAVRGTGLGLFICRMIINAHDGEISAESTLGEGTTFHILLPLMNLKSGEENELIVT
jgi:signal transduction histidine kinase